MRNLAVSIVWMSSLACLCGPPGGADRDDDGFDEAEDCSDYDPDTYPGADEIPYDGLDQDCDGWDLADVDGDGFDSAEIGADDCDDDDPEINPSADEIYYDDADNDCLAETNDQDQDADGIDITTDCDDTDPRVAALVLYYEDIDGDGYGSGPAESVCGKPPADKVAAGDDCDDSDVSISPGAREICGDSLDSNCDGALDPVDLYEPNDAFEEASVAAWDDSDVLIDARLDGADMVDIYIASVTDDAEILINNFYVAAELTVPPNVASVSLALYNPFGYLVSYDNNPADGLYVAFGAPDISSGYGGDYAIEVTAEGVGACADYTLRTYNGY